MRKLIATLCLTVAVLLGSAGEGNALPPCPGSPTSNGFVASKWRGCVGTYNHSNGNTYVGPYHYIKDRLKPYRGTFYYNDGRKYVGQFKYGNINGHGITTYANGDRYVGEYRDGKKHGQGVQYLANGTVHKEGIWENDKFKYGQKVTPNVATKKFPATPPKPEVNQQKRLELARRTQEALQVLGLYSGKLDGILGVRTQHAIQKWQRRSNYPATGNLSESQIIFLEREALATLSNDGVAKNANTISTPVGGSRGDQNTTAHNSIRTIEENAIRCVALNNILPKIFLGDSRAQKNFYSISRQFERVFAHHIKNRLKTKITNKLVSEKKSHALIKLGEEYDRIPESIYLLSVNCNAWIKDIGKHIKNKVKKISDKKTKTIAYLSIPNISNFPQFIDPDRQRNQLMVDSAFSAWTKGGRYTPNSLSFIRRYAAGSISKEEFNAKEERYKIGLSRMIPDVLKFQEYLSKAKLPTKIDDTTTLIMVSANGRVLKYTYQVNEDQTLLKKIDFGDQTKLALKKSLCAEVNGRFSELIELGVRYHYLYQDIKGLRVLDHIVDKLTCSR